MKVVVSIIHVYKFEDGILTDWHYSGYFTKFSFILHQTKLCWKVDWEVALKFQMWPLLKIQSLKSQDWTLQILSCDKVTTKIINIFNELFKQNSKQRKYLLQFIWLLKEVKKVANSQLSLGFWFILQYME